MLALTASNPLDTERIAQRIAALVRAGDLITLVGEIGAGKTYFAQGFGRALGVTEPITSPTFNLLHTYEGGRMPMHHADLYRLERTGEIADLGITAAWRRWCCACGMGRRGGRRVGKWAQHPFADERRNFRRCPTHRHWLDGYVVGDALGKIA